MPDKCVNMFLHSFDVDPKLTVSAIVARDYRTAEVFRKYRIGYCCGGKWPLDLACEIQGLDQVQVRSELQAATRNILISPQVNFKSWEVDFLMDYILNVHHKYLLNSLPTVQELLQEFTNEHVKKFTWLTELGEQFAELRTQLLNAMEQEEAVLFPYIRQIAHAHKGKEAYAVLLVRTLRKSVEDILLKSHEMIRNIILSIRVITSNYTTPENVCTSHKVVIARLKELDNDIMQHFYLEQSILFPKAMDIEKEVLSF